MNITTTLVYHLSSCISQVWDIQVTCMPRLVPQRSEPLLNNVYCLKLVFKKWNTISLSTKLHTLRYETTGCHGDVIRMNLSYLLCLSLSSHFLSRAVNVWHSSDQHSKRPSSCKPKIPSYPTSTQMTPISLSGWWASSGYRSWPGQESLVWG